MRLIHYPLVFALLALLVSFNPELNAQCATPGNPTTLEVQLNSADIMWSAVSGARYYRVRYKKTSDSSWKSKRTRKTSLTLSNLDSGTDYVWKVKTICVGSSSPYTANQSFTTLGSCPVPTPFTPLGIGSHQATLVWQNINNQVDAYNVRWREVGTSSWNTANGISTNLYIVQGLQPLVTYEYQVQSNCGGQSSAFSNSVQWTTPENVCTAPQNFVVTNIGTDFVSLSWGAVGGTEHYRVRFREVGSTTWLFKDFIFVTSTTISNLFPNTIYEAQVQSECTLGATDWSDLLTFTTQQVASCDAPQNLFASMISATSAKHNWDPVVGALQYTMRRRVAGSTAWTDQFTTTETSITTFLLSPATTYEFQVQTHCTIGDSPFSTSAFYTTQGDSPCPPATNLSVDDITPTSADFDWDDVPAALHYRFEWRPQGSSTWSWVITTSSHIGRTGLTPSTVYEWRVGTLCTSGGTYTFTAIETFQTAAAGQCTVPGGLFVLGVGQTQATLLWGTVPEADDYDVRIRPTGTTTWNTFTGVTTNLKVVFGLTPGTEYEFQVQANCPTGSSGFSASDIFTTQAARSILTTPPAGRYEPAVIDQKQLSVYPNPVRDHLVLESPDLEQAAHLMIFDLMGRMLIERKVPENSKKIFLDLSGRNIGPGVYFIQLVDRNKAVVFRTRILRK